MMTNAVAAGLAGVLAAGFLGVAAYLVISRLREKRPRPSASRTVYAGIRTDEQIDEYHLVRRIHDGQNSRVWEVYDEVTAEHLAMKIFKDGAPIDKRMRKSLKHEWVVARQLEHPNIIQLFRFAEDIDSAYIIMEMFLSHNIKERLLSRQQAFLEQHARGIMIQICEAVAFMHGKGWVHRDIKPANILVSKRGGVRLIDFGLAVRATSPRWKRILPRRRLAQGTLSYMSPEQIRGERVDERADIYCLGATFYELLTGRPPLTGNNRSDVLRNHLTKVPAPATAVNAKVSDEFAALLQWMLEKKPERRPPQVGPVLHRLRETPVFKDAAVANNAGMRDSAAQSNGE
jgi:eukaryotic-like serine/threonine-protein kinase